MTETHTQQETRIVREGMKACENGISGTDNPYLIASWKYCAWIAGWHLQMSHNLRRQS